MKTALSKKQLTLGALTVATLFSVLTPVAMAQLVPQRSMTIVPPGVQKSFDPGGITDGIMKVTNDSDETLTFNAVVRDFIVDNDQGTPKILPPNTLSNKYSASSWIGVSPTTFTVLPHQKQELTYFVQVPTNARPGGHYAAIMYTPTTNVASGVTGASVETQIGTLFYIKVNGPITENAQVTRFFVNPFQEYGPVNLITQIKNNGDYHIRPQATITVKNMLNKTVETKQLTERNIFPEALLSYKTELGKHMMIGRYTVTMVGTYGVGGNLPLTATVAFWVFPWKMAALIVLLITIIILGFILAKKHRKNRKRSEPVETTPTEPTTTA